MKTRKAVLVLAALAACLAGYRLAYSEKNAAKAAPAQNVREFTMMNLEYEGTKIWLPSLLIAKKGDRVKIKLINNAPSGEHGFSISELNVVEKVFKGEPRTVEFNADQTGLFKIFCQIHPAHIGGQLLVLE